MRVSFNHTQLCIVSLGLRQQIAYWSKESVAAYERGDREAGAARSREAQEARAALAKVDKLLVADDERARLAHERGDYDQTGVLCSQCGTPLAYEGSTCDRCWARERSDY
jgi:hypothetical protein